MLVSADFCLVLGRLYNGVCELSWCVVCNLQDSMFAAGVTYEIVSNVPKVWHIFVFFCFWLFNNIICF